MFDREAPIGSLDLRARALLLYGTDNATLRERFSEAPRPDANAVAHTTRINGLRRAAAGSRDFTVWLRALRILGEAIRRCVGR